MPVRLFYCLAQGFVSAVEGMEMTSEIKRSRREITPKNTSGVFKARLVWLPAVAMAGLVAWTVLPRPSDAGGEPAATPSPVTTPAQNTSWFNPVITPIDATLVTPADDAAPAQEPPQDTATPVEAAPIDGLQISSQSWRRGGLGSKALVTLTLRNRNDYAVRDVEIFCSFTRRDGSHLTDRKHTIHDTVSMKSRKTFARMHVGFVNINADRAKCALLAASRI
jgi:hypothetical protein